MTTRSMVTALVTALMLTCGSLASAQQQSKCLVGKTKCMATKASGLLKCHQASETPKKPTDPNAGGCITKAEDKFDGGADLAKGCFEKLESKPDIGCITTDDTAA